MEHHHNHEQCHDPNCACHHHHDHTHHKESAHQVAENALVLSERRSFPGPISSADLTARMTARFLELGARADTDGIILGHIKGIVAASDGQTLSFSITRPGNVDLTPSDDWKETVILTDYSITINCMLLTDPGITAEDLFHSL